MPRTQPSLNYFKAESILDGRDSKKIRYKTWLHDRGDHIALRHHKTDIIRFYEDGRIGISNGGYFSPTTKQRLSDRTPDWIGVSQKDYTWRLHIGSYRDRQQFVVPVEGRLHDCLRYGDVILDREGDIVSLTYKDSNFEWVTKIYNVGAHSLRKMAA